MHTLYGPTSFGNRMMQDTPHARFLRGGRQSEAFACYAITKCVDNRRHLLACSDTLKAFSEACIYLRENEQIKLLGFCLMPDHHHLVIYLVGSKTLSQVLKSISQHTAKTINRTRHCAGRIWQKGFYYHRCWDPNDIEDRLPYIEHNPVR